jgi:hypothetical protein
MDGPFLRDTFLYGNLELGYTLREIKKLDIGQISLDRAEFDLSFIWRCYKNFKTLFSVREVDVLNDIDSYKNLLKLYKNYVISGEEYYKISDKFVNVKPACDGDYFIISVYSMLSELDFKLIGYDNQDLSKIFRGYFYDYLPFICGQNVIINFNSPFKDISWKPRWKFIYNSEQINLDFIDCYLDTYFYNTNFKYNPGMYKDICPLKDRLIFLKEKSCSYFQKCILPSLEIVTKNMFDNYPYQIIFREYLEIIDIHPLVFKPDLYKVSNFKSEIGWLLSILPQKLTAYLLGYPVISCGIPSTENMCERIKKIEDEGLEKYISELNTNNKTIINLLSFGVNIANGIDSDGNFVDLLFERVIDYNFDDYILFYNSKACHIFTYPEFNDISKKQINPYNNKTKIPMVDRINQNLEVKHSLKNEIRERGLEIEMTGTLSSNIEDILHNIKSGKIVEQKIKNYRYDVHRRINLGGLFERMGYHMS